MIWLCHQNSSSWCFKVNQWPNCIQKLSKIGYFIMSFEIRILDNSSYNFFALPSKSSGSPLENTGITLLWFFFSFLWCMFQFSFSVMLYIPSNFSGNVFLIDLLFSIKMKKWQWPGGQLKNGPKGHSAFCKN